MKKQEFRGDLFYSSERDYWETPPEIFNPLNEEFDFTLDPCCVPETAKCDRYYTKKEDGLAQNWGGRTCFHESALWS